MTKDEAQRTAAASLSRIEAWSRVTALAAATGVLILAGIACVVMVAAVDYWRFKSAMNEITAKFEEPKRSTVKPVGRPATPPAGRVVF